MRTVKNHLYEQVARIGKAVASPKRLELIELSCQGEKAVETVAAQAEISVKPAGAHLRELRRVRLVETRKEGWYVLCRLACCRGPFCLMAEDAVGLLRKKGYRAIHLSDGVAEWRARGLPIEQFT